jgi:hypothetical protein
VLSLGYLCLLLMESQWYGEDIYLVLQGVPSLITGPLTGGWHPHSPILVGERDGWSQHSFFGQVGKRKGGCMYVTDVPQGSH